MKLGDIIKQSGIEGPKKEDAKKSLVSPSAPRRRYFWDQEESQPTATKEELNTFPAVKMAQSKVEPNMSQSEVKLEPMGVAEPEPKLSQTKAKVEPNISRKTPVKIKVEPQPEPNHKPKLSQSSAKVQPILFFEELVGLQRKVLLHIFEMCVRTGSRITPPVAISNLAQSLETTVSAGRKAIQRLEEKKFINRSSFKDGRGGWTKYELKEELYKSLLLDNRTGKLEPNLSQSRAKVSTQPEPQPEPSSPCSSSSSLNLNNTTTTEEPIWLNIPEKLQGQLPINQLRAMVKSGVVDHETMEDSLWGFALDLEKGLVKSKTGNTTGLFIGALKNGGYISQQYLAQKQKEAQELRERVVELQKIQEELEGSKLAEEFEAFKKEFPEQAEAMKPMSSYIKNFDEKSVGYKLWIDEFRKQRVKSGNA